MASSSDIELINELFSLWEALAEAGELRIGVGFSNRFDGLQSKVENARNSYNQCNCLVKNKENTQNVN